MSGTFNFQDPGYTAGLVNESTGQQWVQGASNTISAPTSGINITDIPRSKQHMVLMHLLSGTGTAGARITLNNSNQNVYAFTRSVNDGPDDETSFVSQPYMSSNDTSSGDIFQVAAIGDVDGEYKMSYIHSMDSQGTAASVAPRRVGIIGKANITSQPINRIDVNNVNPATQTYGINSNVASCSIGTKPVTGRSFWEVIGTNRLETAGNSISITGLPNRRYLWIQSICKPDVSVLPALRFNNDSGQSYSDRVIANFTSATTQTSEEQIRLSNTINHSLYINMWVANLATSVKLVTGFSSTTNGDNVVINTPLSFEFSGKWANTADAINRADIINRGGGNFDIGTSFTIWGSAV